MGESLKIKMVEVRYTGLVNFHQLIEKDEMENINRMNSVNISIYSGFNA